jgi:hypothetical protein
MLIECKLAVKKESQVSPIGFWDQQCVACIGSIPQVKQGVGRLMGVIKVEQLSLTAAACTIMVLLST